MEFTELRTTQHELANGTTILAVERPGTEATSIQVWCETGSINEGAWAGSGLTHLLEHMLFKGTAQRSAVRIAEEIHRHGGYLNAYTSFDRTVYWVDCPRSALGPSLEVLADMTFRSSIEPAELEREMDVIRREFEMGYDDPDRLLSQLTFATAYQAHPCRFPVIGLREIFDRLNHAAVMDYYRRRYVPNNVFVVVAGDFAPEAVRDEVERAFSFAQPAPLEAAVLPEEPRQQGRRSRSRVFDAELGYFNLAFHIPPLFSPDTPALDITSVILGGGVSSVLYKSLRQERGLVYGINAFSYTPAFPGLLTISGTCAEKGLDSVEHEVMSALRQWRRHALEQAQLEKAKRVIWVTAIEQLQTVKGIATDAGLNWLYTRNVNYSHRYLEKVWEVTREQVADVCDRFLVEDNLSFTSLQPHLAPKARPVRRPLPAEPEIVTLAPHGEVLLIPDARLPLLHASAIFRGGVLAEGPGQGGLARLHSQCAVKATRRRNPAVLAEQIESLGGSLFGDSGYNSVRLTINTLAADSDRLLDIFADVLAEPVFPPGVLERERESQLAAIRADDAQPYMVARRILRRAVYRDHPYAHNVLGTVDSVGRLTQGDLHAMNERTVLGGSGLLAFSGQFDRNRLLDQLTARLPAMPRERTGVAADVPPAQPLEDERITHRDQRNQAITMIGFLACSLYDPDRVAFELLDEATGDSSSRFFIRIREELGLAYSVGTSLSLGLAPGLFTVYAATSPNAVERVAELCHEQVKLIAEHGLSEREFERAKARLQAQYAFQKQNLDGYAHATALNVLYGLGPRYQEARQEAIGALTLESVQAICRKYLMDKPSVTVIVKP
ncbi:MAG: insulinase family protein [Verrucomicrobia bacterium]|nr:insulinase family protein [Verrucomicrobiota bacterium]